MDASSYVQDIEASRPQAAAGGDATAGPPVVIPLARAAPALRLLGMPRVTDIVDATYHALHGRDRAVSIAVLEHARHAAPPPPDFLAGEIDSALAEQMYGASVAEPVSCIAIEGGYVGPTCIAISGTTALFSELSMHPAHHVRRVVDGLLGPDLPVRHIAGKLALIYGPAHQTWGHWICDFLPRLHVLARAGHDLSTLRYVVPPDLKPFEAQLLQAVGIPPERLVRYAYGREILRADVVLVPSGFRTDDCLNAGFADATRAWINGLGIAMDNAQATEKLFISRAGAPGERVVINRSVIEALAKARGYRIVYPETVDVAAQLSLFASASVIIGEYGSALHNTVFAPAGAKICALRGTSRHPGFVQTSLCAALGQKIGYVFGDTRSQNVEQRFRIEPQFFERALTWLDLP